MAYWLVKTEPSDYAFEDLVKEKKVVWSGVKNALAKKHLRAMAKGDEVLVYHTGDVKAVVGLGKVSKAAAESGEPEIAAGKTLKRAVTLAEIKGDARFAAWGLVKIGRLSVVPTTAEQFAAILELAGAAK